MVTISGLFRTQISKTNFFKRINSFQQKAPSQMFERFWIYLWCRSLKYCNFKTSNLPSPWKMKKRLYILYILNKITLTTEIRSTVLHNLFLLDVSVFNVLVIKNDPVKKSKVLLSVYGGGSTISRPSLGTKRQKFSLQSFQ